MPWCFEGSCRWLQAFLLVVFVLFMPLEATLSQSVLKHQGVEGLPFAMAVPSWWDFKEGQDENSPTTHPQKKPLWKPWRVPQATCSAL